MSSVKGTMNDRLLLSPTVASRQTMGTIHRVIPVAFIKWSYSELLMNKLRWEEIAHEYLKFYYLQRLPQIVQIFMQRMISLYRIGELIEESKCKGESRFKLDSLKEDNLLLTEEDVRVLEGLTIFHRLYEPPNNWSIISSIRYRNHLEEKKEENSEHISALKDMENIYRNFKDIPKAPANTLSNLVCLSWYLANWANCRNENELLPIPKSNSEDPAWFHVLNNLKLDLGELNELDELFGPYLTKFGVRVKEDPRTGPHFCRKMVSPKYGKEVDKIKNSSPDSYLPSLSRAGIFSIPRERLFPGMVIAPMKFYSSLPDKEWFNSLPVILPNLVLFRPGSFLQGKGGTIFQYKEGGLVGKDKRFPPLFDLLFAHSIIEWIEGNKNLICPLIGVRREIDAFEKGCPLDEDRHIPGTSSGYCVGENKVSLDEAKKRNCLFWSIFSQIFEGFDLVEGG